MARSADSLAVFVVQRHFRRVLRGYDPEEVERHLERVSEWFNESRVGQVAREVEARLDARERAVLEVEAKGRAEADGAERARREAESTLAEARRKADALVEEARRPIGDAGRWTTGTPPGARVATPNSSTRWRR
jgi:DivIVA domain-containing protein